MAITKTEMTLRQAFNVIREDPVDPIAWQPEEKQRFDAASAIILARGYCPSCAAASEPMRSRLFEWEPGSFWENAGRACPNCEEFYVCGEQPEYGNASDEWRGDADPGL